jgi:hypothetical protein
MSCALCTSANQMEFTAEMMIHFKNIELPGVLVFPRVLVCLGCGSSRFSVPPTELVLLARSKATSEASARTVVRPCVTSA